ncbi:Glycoside hydrolase, superfamily [Penicillium expansum]|nr:Glycoside hydrolase, superfamily [Penicillium expansum]
MPVRIGGTTQDRARYDPDFDGYVSYKVNNSLEAPKSLIYGPKFFDLIGNETMLGLNCGLNNRGNTFSAALEARAMISKQLWGLELGNEPDLFEYWKYPVAVAPWKETQEGANAADWAQDFINHWKTPLPILAGGGYAVPFEVVPPWPNLPYLIETAYNQTIKDATKFYNGHLYSLENATANSLNIEMNHQRTVSDLNMLPISSDKSVNRPYVLGETGFHSGDYEMDATLGFAIQTVDKTLHGLALGIQRIFYHQGTINQAFFNWWWSDRVNAPFYGGYFAALAIEGGDSISASDDGNDSYAQYVVYKKGKPFKVILVNTNYYSGNGSRSVTNFTMTGLKNGYVEALRMTGPSSETLVPRLQTDPSLEPSIGGQYFSNDDCSLRGAQNFEEFTVEKHRLTISLTASEV